MSENNQLFDMASLAEAAYANLSENGLTITTFGDVKTSLLTAGWSDSLSF